MMKKIITSILALVFLTIASISTVNAADNGYGKQKVVYHINYDDPKKQKGALVNIQNHINAVGAENMEIKVVLHGNGLALLLEPDSLANVPKFKHANATDKMTVRIDGLKDQGVVFNVCNNTVKGRKVSVDNDLYNVEQSEIVPSGVAELAKLQMQGYTYIKP
ncbi:DsrE family protein [uncultured Cocleimonas sp.]|uniref:DsrE family protein n=1 Tax=uncultured Cocleimonas sp. TaxID=1051587 RepID=UPI00261E1801|nr:DsrE family protein [uncultured Cocleimonas sp.]